MGIRARWGWLGVAVAVGCGLGASAGLIRAQAAGEAAGVDTAGPPPSDGGVFPLSEVHRGLMGTAWTVFTGTKPEPMQVEILGILRGARGPGHDMILAQLHGTKAEYTGVVAGMSGSPVYIGTKLLGSLSYRIGQFSKDPIAGITPIGQMLEVRDVPFGQGLGIRAQRLMRQGAGVRGQGSEKQGPGTGDQGLLKQGSRFGGQKVGEAVQDAAPGMNFQAMETPLVMSGFGPEAVKLWKQQMAGTGLDVVAGGGVGGDAAVGSSMAGANSGLGSADLKDEPSAVAAATIVPGSAVSAQLVRGDIEIAATCTVTYVDPKQLLACGHPILQAGAVSLPMTTTDVVATLASPLNAFKIINTGELIGTFTDDRDAAIRGVFGQKPDMIPVHIGVHVEGTAASADRKLNIEILNLPSLTAQAMLVSLYQALTQTNQSSAEMSYHLTGSIDVAGEPISRLDEWAPASEGGTAALELALVAGGRFARIYGNESRRGAIRGIDLHVEAVPRHVGVELQTARIVSGDIVHAGDTVMVEATVRGWHEAARNVRIPVKLPARLGAGQLRILVSDAGTLDRTIDQPRLAGHPVDLEVVLAEARLRHAADRIYVSVLVPESQANVGGQNLASLPLSVANALEPLRGTQDASLNGETAEWAADAGAGGVLSGFQILGVHIEPGGSLN